MKNICLSLLLFCCGALGATTINFSLPKSFDHLYLASYYGDGVVVVDSFRVVEGVAQWSSVDDLAEGMYFISDGPGGARFDFLLGADQTLDVYLKGLSPYGAFISGADESRKFLAYQQFAAKAKGELELSSYIRESLDGASKESFYYLVLMALLPPPSQNASSMMVLDSEAVYEYNIAHFWDNYDLLDERLVYTPFFAPRVDAFLRNVLMPREDKILPPVLDLLSKVEACNPVLKIVASKSLAFSRENTIMGIDALAYELISRYYLKGYFGVLSAKHTDMLVDYVKHTESCRIGLVGNEILLDNWEKERGEVSLYAVDAPYVLLLFWEPDCDYCKVVVPALRDEIYAKYAAKGLRIFAVNTQRDYAVWSEYIVANDLGDWSHGYRALGHSDFMIDYGVQGTPSMYILDKDKRIVAKNVKLDFVDPMLARLFTVGSIY